MESYKAGYEDGKLPGALQRLCGQPHEGCVGIGLAGARLTLRTSQTTERLRAIALTNSSRVPTEMVP